jgi:hypothetical protein
VVDESELNSDCQLKLRHRCQREAKTENYETVTRREKVLRNLKTGYSKRKGILNAFNE